MYYSCSIESTNIYKVIMNTCYQLNLFEIHGKNEKKIISNDIYEQNMFGHSTKKLVFPYGFCFYICFVRPPPHLDSVPWGLSERNERSIHHSPCLKDGTLLKCD